MLIGNTGSLLTSMSHTVPGNLSVQRFWRLLSAISTIMWDLLIPLQLFSETEGWMELVGRVRAMAKREGDKAGKHAVGDDFWS